jgi:hypothetical protein
VPRCARVTGATVPPHARFGRLRHPQRRGRARRLGRGPGLERAARLHHRRIARCRRARGARPRARRHPVQRPALAHAADHREPRAFRGPKRRRGPRPSHRGGSPGRRRRAEPRLYRGSRLLWRAGAQRVATPCPGDDRPDRRGRPARNGGAAVRRAGSRAGRRRRGARRGHAGRAGRHPAGRRPLAQHTGTDRDQQRPRPPTCAARPSAAGPSRWPRRGATIS